MFFSVSKQLEAKESRDYLAYKKLQMHNNGSLMAYIQYTCIFSFLGKFLPMKTMLGPRYDDQVAEENRFHPSMLSNYLKSLKVRNSAKTEVLNFYW